MTDPRQPCVAVLLATHNGEQWVAAQVESILDQDGVRVLIHARDDASADGTLQRLRCLAQSSGLRVDRATEPGGSAAANFLAMFKSCPAEDADFVALSDQDDVWLPGKLQRAVNCLTESDCAGYSCATIAFWPDGRQKYLGQDPRMRRADYLFEGAGQGCTFVMRRDFYQRARTFLLENAGLASQLHFHDWALYALARSWGLKWYFDPKPMLKYRQHGKNDTGARTGLAGAVRRLGRIRQGWYTLQLRTIAQLCVHAAPGNAEVARWSAVLARPPGLIRRLRIAGTAARLGRRRPVDRVVLVLSALLGWI